MPSDGVERAGGADDLTSWDVLALHGSDMVSVVEFRVWQGRTGNAFVVYEIKRHVCSRG